MATFAERLVSLRRERHLTQAQLADRLGISKSTVSMYESGQRIPTFENADMIADYFHVDLRYLLGHSDVVEAITGTPEDDGAHVSAKVTQEELAMLDAYRLSSNDTRSAVLRILRVEP